MPRTLFADTSDTSAYDALRLVATRKLNGQGRYSHIEASELVHEAFLKMTTQGQRWNTRSHFMATAGVAMRQVLANDVRYWSAEKRGGGTRAVAVELDSLEDASDPEIVRSLNAALLELKRVNPNHHRLVDCRFFIGLTAAETANAMGVSRSTVTREWHAVRTWLRNRLDES